MRGFCGGHEDAAGRADIDFDERADIETRLAGRHAERASIVDAVHGDAHRSSLREPDETFDLGLADDFVGEQDVVRWSRDSLTPYRVVSMATHATQSVCIKSVDLHRILYHILYQ